MDLLPLVHGLTKGALLDPSLVRLPESEVKVNWAKPVVRIAQGDEVAPWIQELHVRGLIRAVADDKVWTHGGQPVLNGMFGVPKPTAAHKKVEVAGMDDDQDL